MIKKILVPLSIFFFTLNGHAESVGWSVFPLAENQKIITAQVGGVFSEGGGMGIQASYIQKLSPKWTVEGGAGVTGGDRGFTFYGDADYELYPDFEKQPRISIKGWYQYSNEYDSSINRFYASPIVSKGMVFWGNEGYPYVSIPTGVSLNYDNKKYSLFSSFVFGISGKVPWEKMKNVIMLVEARLNISGAYSGLNLGFSYSI